LTVSKYFSDIRGTPSVFSRGEDGFMVDGHKVSSLSGSALDALGLAIRMALPRTFLPNARFLVLDEPAAAADDNRETNMLGVIATYDADQVILVTHSDLADSFAAQVIRL
jgi:ABC-type transport system involved in cytochrome bd biosynthesis fused ATPase/permease subunit